MIWTILAALSLALWLYLVFARGGYWRASERLAPSPEPSEWPEIVAVIPARNEAESIGPVIAAHMASDYPGAFSVVLVDDNSEDETAGLARAAAEGGARRLEIVKGAPLQKGWTGKLWAQSQGIARAAEIAPGARYLLLTDADIVHAPFALRRLVAKAEYEDLALASLMARLDARGLWGGLLIPAFVYFFQMLYPFPLSNRPSNPIAAAAGGCMLVRRAALDEEGGVAAIHSALIDDCALAQLIKRPGSAAPRRTWIGLADNEVLSLRDNRPLRSVWDMVARTAFVQLDHSALKLAGTVAGMALLYVVPLAGVLFFPMHRSIPGLECAAAAYALMAASYRPTSSLYGQSIWKILFLPVAGALYTAMTFSSALRHWRGAGGLWKGRTYT